MSGYGNVDDEQLHAQAFIDVNIAFVRSLLPTGESRSKCIECDDVIPIARQNVLPGVKHCINCQHERDKNKVKLKPQIQFAI
jgi:RNA polymerase-binding transcription factor DksA